MLNKMQAAVESIAELYGNPTFLQVFTNDIGSASELKERLKTDRHIKDIRSEIESLEKRRDELLSDIALKEKQTGKLEERLIKQRSALDALATAIEQARRAVEETAK
jgi:predicted  nucleic acid-binding Zn-ribbon protein